MNTNNETKRLVKKIILTTIFTIVISIIWSNISTIKADETSKLLASTNNLVISETNNNDYLYKMNDDEAIKNLKTNIINIKNTNNAQTKCNILLRVNKTSTLNIKKVKYLFNGEIKTFVNLEHEDSLYYYYEMGNISIDAKTDSFNEYVMWLDENSTDTDNKTMSYKIVVSENTVLAYK